MSHKELADRYFEDVCGFDLSLIKNCYEQGTINDYTTGKFYNTCRFYLDDKKKTFWEFLLDGQKEFGRDDNFHPDLKKKKLCTWIPIEQSITPGDTVYLTLNIKDALALMHNKKKVACIMTAGEFDNAFFDRYLHLDIKWVIAFGDNEKEQASAKKLANALQTKEEAVSAAVPVDSCWLDLYTSKKLKENDWREYEYTGDKLLAKTAMEKAFIIYHHRERLDFSFTFNMSTYGFKFNLEKFITARDRIEKEWKEKAEQERKRIIEEAKMKACTILSEARREARIKISMAKKEVFDSVVEKALKDLKERKGFDVKKSLLNLLKESLEYIDEPTKIIINEKDSQALREVFEELNIKDIYIIYSDKIIGGVIVESRIGELIDNSYDTRIKRARITYAPEIHRILWG